MILEKGWRKFLLEKYDITPESIYMGVNELLTLKCMRDELEWPDYYVLTYDEYEKWVTGSLINKSLKKHKL